MEAKSIVYTYERLSFRVNISVARGMDNKFLGVHICTADNYTPNPGEWYGGVGVATRIFYKIDGVIYMVQSQAHSERCQVLIDWVPPRIITPEAPEDNLTTITITQVLIFTTKWVECSTEQPDRTFTYCVALDADADGTPAIFYPWRFWWGPYNVNCFPRALWGPFKGVKETYKMWNAPGTLNMPRSWLAYQNGVPASYCAREDDAKVLFMPNDGTLVSVDGVGEVTELPAVTNKRLNMLPVPGTSGVVNMVIGIFITEVGEDVEFTLSHECRQWDDIALGYRFDRYTAIRPFYFEGIRIGIDKILIETEDTSTWRPYMFNVKFDSAITTDEYPFITSYTPYPTPYVMKMGGARWMPSNPLRECDYDCVIYWINANGTPYTLPMSVTGGKMSAKLQDGGAYGGDGVAILRSPSLTTDEMASAVTITESPRIAIKFKEDMFSLYPADEWTWAMVDDVEVVNVYDEQTQTVEISLITRKI